MQEAEPTSENPAETAPSGPSQCPFCRYLVGSRTRATICPECGKPLEPRKYDLLLEHAPLRTLRKLRIGIVLIVTSLGPLYASIANSACGRHPGVPSFGWIGLTGTVLMAGWLLVGFSRAQHLEFPHEARQRKFARLHTMLAAALLVALVLPGLQAITSGRPRRVLFGLGLASLILMTQLGWALSYLASMCRRIPDPRLAGTSDLLGKGWLVAAVATGIGLALAAIRDFGNVGPPGLSEMPLVAISVFILLPLSIVTLWYYPLLAWRFGRWLNRIIRAKRAGSVDLSASTSPESV